MKTTIKKKKNKYTIIECKCGTRNYFPNFLKAKDTKCSGCKEPF